MCPSEDDRRLLNLRCFKALAALFLAHVSIEPFLCIFSQFNGMRLMRATVLISGSRGYRSVVLFFTRLRTVGVDSVYATFVARHRSYIKIQVH